MQELQVQDTYGFVIIPFVNKIISSANVSFWFMTAPGLPNDKCLKDVYL